MLASLPLLALACLLLAFRDREGSWRRAVLPAALSWGALLTFVTEALSPAGLVRPAWLAGAWLAVSAGALGAWWRGRARGHALPAERREPVGGFDRALLGGIALVFVLTAIVAVAAPPNTWDALTYHMSRVAHWAQDGSVRHFPTHISRQIAQPPGAEMILLHLVVLGGSDRAVNLVQLVALLGSVVLVTLVAERFGVGRRGKVLAAVFAATLPMAIVQASSTQNDLAGGFWLLGLAYVVLGRPPLPGKTEPPRDTLWLGLSLGLAILTKATGYVFALPFLVWKVAADLRARGLRAIGPLALAALVALAVNAGPYARNYETFGSPLGMQEYPLQNTLHSPAALASNVLRNLALHLVTGVPAVDAAVADAVRAMHAPLGLDPDDRRTTWSNEPFVLGRHPLHDDYAANPLHLLLVAAAVAALAAGRRVRPPGAAAWLAALSAGFLIFCAYLKWQPWHSRLHLPLFVAASPLVGVALERWPARLSRWTAVALLAGTAPFLLRNESRPLVGPRNVLETPRREQYFADHPEMYESYERVAQRARELGCRDIGLLVTGDAGEYLFWVLLDAGRAGGPRLRHVRVHNRSAAAGRDHSPALPCAIASIDAYHRAAMAIPGKGRVDFDGDGVSDVVVYQPSSRFWYVRYSATGTIGLLDFGAPDTVPVPGDYDGDGRADLALYAPSGVWYIRSSSSGARADVTLGGKGFTPVMGDFDGDGRMDPAVHHEATGLWYMRLSGTGAVASVDFGGPGCDPVACDFDGDGRTDVASYHRESGLWLIRLSRTGRLWTAGFGEAGDVPRPADYDGDGRCDLAVYRPREGRWIIRRSSTGTLDVVDMTGAAGEPVAADFDGDGRADPSLYDASAGRWTIRLSWDFKSEPLVGFGGKGFVPVD